MKKRYTLKATVYDSKGRKLSSAFNAYNRSHPLQKHFSKLAGESEHKIYLHAEIAALLKARNKVAYSICIERKGSKGNLALAAPCKSCRVAIKSFGIKELIYTSDNSYVKEIIK